MIFAASPEADVPALRPRIVSHDMIRQEEAQWSKWHEEQSAIERRLMDTTGP